jgi:DNA polymerase-2
MRHRGWILDVYPVSQGMCLWILEENGQQVSCVDIWKPRFYLKARSGFEKDFQLFLQRFNIDFELSIVEKKDFFTGNSSAVVSVQVSNPLMFSSVVNQLVNNPSVILFNADLPLGQYYFYERGLFPLARCSFDVDKHGFLQAWHLEDSAHEVIYELPPFRYAHLGVDGVWGRTSSEVSIDPSHRGRGSYLLTLGEKWGDGVTYEMDASEEDLIKSINRHLDAWDPDVILTDWGDSYIFPRLQRHSERTGIPLRLSRDPDRKFQSLPSHSFFSYGKMVFRAGSKTLYGRLHIDLKNSFSVSHTYLYGLYEIARMAKIPIQRAARCTIGTSLSSLQYEWAIRHDCLIPVDKGQTEDFRSADTLLASDRGGLVYEPEVGWYEDLTEFDFSSMYPEIMVRHNVTPEAVNCACCPDNKVPEIAHHLCRTRGMIPDVLEPLVEKRKKYKQLIRAGHPQKVIFKARYDAFKWALVTSFGYLGFRNARFGRIEAHECVNAYSREALLKAKEVAENRGFKMIHAIVDSLWLQKKGTTDEELEKLRQDIEAATGLPLGLEGRYQWIRFCPSKTNALSGVPNRYFGAFKTGELKVRGIELRRHDTPLFIKNLQQELLKKMAEAKNMNEIKKAQSDLEEIVATYRDRLRNGQVTPMELAVTLHLTRQPFDYVNDTLSALAAQKLATSGVQLHVGEPIQFIVTEEHDAVKDWRVTPLAFIDDEFDYDRKYYERLIQRTVDTLLYHPLLSAPCLKPLPYQDDLPGLIF